MWGRRKNQPDQWPPEIGKDGVGGSIPLDGTISPYKSTIHCAAANRNCCKRLQNVAEFEGIGVGKMFRWRSIWAKKPIPAPTNSKRPATPKGSGSSDQLPRRSTRGAPSGVLSYADRGRHRAWASPTGRVIHGGGWRNRTPHLSSAPGFRDQLPAI